MTIQIRYDDGRIEERDIEFLCDAFNDLGDREDIEKISFSLPSGERVIFYPIANDYAWNYELKTNLILNARMKPS